MKMEPIVKIKIFIVIIINR